MQFSSHPIVSWQSTSQTRLENWFQPWILGFKNTKKTQEVQILLSFQFYFISFAIQKII